MSGIDWVLDTNVVIGFLGGRPETISFLTECSRRHENLAVSQITRMELLSFPRLTPEEEAAIHRFLHQINVISFNEEIEDWAVRIRRATRIRLPDAIVAATAAQLNCPLATGDEALLTLSYPGCRIVRPSAEKASESP